MGYELELLQPLFILSYPVNVDNIALLIYLFISFILFAIMVLKYKENTETH